jgi:Putative polyhydroxyalkanoic acid system protein (PHA_gran_rgn)
MSQPLVISVPHRLGKEEALRRLKPGLSALTGNTPMLTVEEETWNGDELTFRVGALGQSASGTLQVADDHIRIAVVLPWLLQQVAGGLEAAIKARGKVLLEDKSQPA